MEIEIIALEFKVKCYCQKSEEVVGGLVVVSREDYVEIWTTID